MEQVSFAISKILCIERLYTVILSNVNFACGIFFADDIIANIAQGCL